MRNTVDDHIDIDIDGRDSNGNEVGWDDPVEPATFINYDHPAKRTPPEIAQMVMEHFGVE